METVPLCGVGVEDLRGRIDMDSYALIPAHTRFTDLLQAALVKLGYSEELTQARGEWMIGCEGGRCVCVCVRVSEWVSEWGCEGKEVI